MDYHHRPLRTQDESEWFGGDDSVSIEVSLYHKQSEIMRGNCTFHKTSNSPCLGSFSFKWLKHPQGKMSKVLSSAIAQEYSESERAVEQLARKKLYPLVLCRIK